MEYITISDFLEMAANGRLQLSDKMSFLKRHTHNFDEELIKCTIYDLISFVGNRNISIKGSNSVGEYNTTTKFFLLKHGLTVEELLNDYNPIGLFLNHDKTAMLTANISELEELSEVYLMLTDIHDYLSKVHAIDLPTKKSSTRNGLKKPHTSFKHLFKETYRGKLDIFIQRLQTNQLIDKDRKWIIKNKTNTPAKLFFYLDKKEALHYKGKTAALKCFYNEFGGDVVEKATGEERTTTRKNAFEAEYSIDQKEFAFLNSWIKSE